MRIRKVHRKKKYKHVNKKKLRNKMSKLPAIGCKEVKNAWDVKKTIITNLGQMGLSYDPNKTIGIPSNKKQKMEEALKKIIVEKNDTKSDDENETNPKEEVQEIPRPKKFVVENLEADATAPRPKQYNLPQSQFNFVTYMMEKYGDDYKAMEKDKKNYYQLTWKQIRKKMEKFKKFPKETIEKLQS